MRWKEKVKPERGAIKKRRAFLFLPKKLRGEYRWLEFATILQQCCYDYYSPKGYRWDDDSWGN